MALRQSSPWTVGAGWVHRQNSFLKKHPHLRQPNPRESPEKTNVRKSFCAFKLISFRGKRGRQRHNGSFAKRIVVLPSGVIVVASPVVLALRPGPRKKEPRSCNRADALR
jgi:hypothetical protein